MLENGALTALEAHGLSLLLFPSTDAEAGPANVHLRQRDGDRMRHVPLLGPASPSRVRVTGAGLQATGRWGALGYRLTLRPAERTTAWCWHLDVTNHGDDDAVVDAVLTHDPALASAAAVATNEYYVSQYLDITPVPTPDHGTAVGVRQNMPGPRHPWLLLGCLTVGTGWATDAHQLVQRTPDGVRWSGLDAVDLPGARLQHEHALVALQDSPAVLPPGHTHRTGFAGILVEDHPDATGPADAAYLTAVIADDAGEPPPAAAPTDEDAAGEPRSGPLTTAEALACRPLTAAELTSLGLTAEPGSEERGPDGTPTTWLTDRGELVTAARETEVLRPHGQILRTGDTLSPDAATLTSTVWMAGTFHSQVTRGHVGRDPLLTGRRSYVGLFRGEGLRLLVHDGDGWRLLDTPSAWCAGLDACWWWYATDDGLLLEVVARAPSVPHELSLEVRVVSGSAPHLLASLHLGPGPGHVVGDHAPDGLDLGPWRLSWSGDVEVTDAGEWLLLDVAAADAWRLAVTATAPTAGERPTPGPDIHLGAGFWTHLAGSLTLQLPGDGAAADDITAIAAATPWFTHNALVHYLAPRGLEQFTGGGWGTRDVCQGPVGLLTALDRPDEVADVLLRVFAAQNARGDWPQAFDFLPPVPDHGQQESHGDVVFWPLLAVGEHLQTTGDAGLLGASVPFVGDDGPTAPAGVEEHLARAVGRVEEMAVPGTPLPAYGHGDWNDSLQPADPDAGRPARLDLDRGAPGAGAGGTRGRAGRRVGGPRPGRAGAGSGGPDPRGDHGVDAARRRAVGLPALPCRGRPASRWCTRATPAPVSPTGSCRGCTPSPVTSWTRPPPRGTSR